MNRNSLIQAAYFLLRVVVGLLFFQVGAMKWFGWFGGMPGSTPGHPIIPHLTSQVGIAGILEIGGGLLILVGLCVRPIAFVLCGEMAVAYWQFHAPRAPWPIMNNGQPAVLYCFIFLFMAAYGSGAWSLDALLKRGRKSETEN